MCIRLNVVIPLQIDIGNSIVELELLPRIVVIPLQIDIGNSGL